MCTLAPLEKGVQKACSRFPLAGRPSDCREPVKTLGCSSTSHAGGTSNKDIVISLITETKPFAIEGNPTCDPHIRRPRY